MTQSSRRIHIFRAGTHAPMTGGALTFAEADLAAIAASYDPARHEAPVVLGHPATDDPAQGWVRRLEARGADLYAEVDQIEPAFAEHVRAGRFKKISPAFYTPRAPANPAPGSYYLKHVGFLGATAPAVKGLEPPVFSAAEEGVVALEFGEAGPAESFRQTRRLFQGLRDLLIEKFGLAAADAAVPPWSIDLLEPSVDLDPAFADPSPQPQETPPMAPPSNPSDPPTPDPQDLERRARELEAREAAFAEVSRAARRAADEALLDRLAAEGRPVMGERRPQLLAFMESLDDAEAVAFGEGATARTRSAFFREFLQALPKVTPFGEAAPAPRASEGATAAFAAPADYDVDPQRADLHRRAMDRALERKISYADAVRELS